MKKVVLLLTLVSSLAMWGSVSNVTRHGLAVCEGNKGKWDAAYSHMMHLLAQNYDDPQILYDAGVAAYRTGQYEQARAYFQDCCACDNAVQQLRERALFNKGNANVAMEKLDDALQAYEQVLELDAANQEARHNRDKVKEMLEQQKQQKENKDQNKRSENQENSNDQKRSDDKDDSNREHENEENDNEKQKNEEHENNENMQNQKQSNQENTDNGRRSPEQENANNDAGDNNGSQGESSRQDGQAEQNLPEDSKKNHDVSQEGNDRDSGRNQGEGESQDGKKSGAQDNQKMQPGAKNESEKNNAPPAALEPDEQSKNLERNERALTAVQEKNDDLFGPQQAWMAQLLQAQENSDKEINKKMTKAALTSAGAQNNGTNSW